MGRLDNTTALITGASSGIGKAIALGCAREGADVALVARRKDALDELAREIRAGGRRAIVCPADVTKDGEGEAAVEQTLAELGHIDLLVNNAGSNLWERTIAKTSVEDYRSLIELNLISAYRFTAAILPAMTARRAGTIVNIGSTSVLTPSTIAGVAYVSAKAGMDGLTRFTNTEGNESNVRACFLCTGSTDTELLDFRDNPTTRKQRDVMLRGADVAEAVIFVAALPPTATVDSIILRPTWRAG